jgi:hypothetical protein
VRASLDAVKIIKDHWAGDPFGIVHSDIEKKFAIT